MPRRGPLLLAALLFLTLGAERAGRLVAQAPGRSPRVVTYTIRAELDPAEQAVHGEMELVWRNTSEQPVDRLWFHLYLNAFRDEHSSFMRGVAATRPDAVRRIEEHPGSIEVTSMRREDGAELWTDGTRRFEAPDDGNERDRTLASVALPSPVSPGETIALRMDFLSRLPRVLARTGWAGDPEEEDELFFMVAQWFPKIAVLRTDAGWNAHQFHRNTEFFSDFGTYQVTITAPEDFVVGATGRRVSRQSDPATGLAVHVYREEDVHDFAWTAAPWFREHLYRWSFDEFCEQAPGDMGARARALLERTAAHLDVPADRLKPTRPVEVRILIPPDHADLAPRFQWSAGAALACYGIWFGAYPYENLTIVDPPACGRSAGGMEYPTLITVFGDRTAPDYARGMEGVTIHEFGHQYFYGLVATNEFEEAWLDEGLTSFTGVRAEEETYPSRIASTRYRPLHTPYARHFRPVAIYERLHELLSFESWLGRLPRPWDRPEELFAVPKENGLWAYLRDMPFLHFPRRRPVTIPARWRQGVLSSESHDSFELAGWEFASRDEYRVNAYSRPMLFLYCLRGLMGEPAFDRALHAYATGQRFGHPAAGDLLAALRAEVPAEARAAIVDAFIDSMVSSAARVDVAVLSAVQREVGEKWEWTVRVQRRGALPVPIRLRLVDEGGASEHLPPWNSRGGETTRTFRVLRDRRMRAVHVEPGWLRFVDTDLSNNARVVDGFEDATIAARLAARWALHAEEVVRSYAGMAR